MNQGIYYGQLVIGPAGSGKSTFCKHMQQMAQTLRRNIIIINLDPASQHSQYRCDIDIKQLITLDDVMQQMQLGPNGALLFTIQYLLQNQQWLIKQLDQVIKPDDYVIFDCPGQIELYSDRSLFRQICKILQQYGFSLISMYMIDVNFIGDNNKYASGILQALSAQIALELPSITVLTKCDLIQGNKQGGEGEGVQKQGQRAGEDKLQRYLNYFTRNQQIVEQELMDKNYDTLPDVIRKILNQNSQVSIRALNLEDEDSVRNLLWEADNAIQYGENIEPDDRLFQQAEKGMNQ